MVFVERTPQRWPRVGIRDFLEWFRRTGQGAAGIAKPVDEGIQVKSVRVLPPARWLRWLNRRIIRKAFADVPPDDGAARRRTVLITYVPTYNAIDIIDTLRPGIVAYVNVHNYEASPQRVMKDLFRAERRLAADSDVLLADSIFNAQRLSRLAGSRNVRLAPPGVSYKLFRQAYRGDETESPETVYYFGGIHAVMDMPLYNALAEHLRVVFVGQMSAEVRNQVSPRIEVRPPVPNADLPRAVREADVLALFYKPGDYTRAVMPAKLFECMATGKPVLTSGLGETERYADAIYCLDGSLEAVLATVKTLRQTDTPERLARRDELARQADWNNRFRTFVQTLLTSRVDHAEEE